MSDARVVTPATDRRWLWALGLLLPAGFRDRQRGEWAADLATLAADPAARRRYLLATVRTLPALRAAARGHESVLPAEADPAGAITASRIVITLLAWSIIGWLTTVLTPYLYSRAGRDLPAWLVETTPFTPVLLVLGVGGLGTVVGYALTFIASLTTLVLAVAERRRPAYHRFGGIMTAVALFVVASAQAGLGTELRFHADGLALLTLAGLTLTPRRTGLSRPRRTLLAVLSCLAAAVIAVLHTPFGTALQVWYLG
ncbi:hypothetical protein J2S43_001372 [Catenuloplanes nepalensis]|uniref:Uncharacterized protein n=1 Tax=Catenuloplanes nepalensis TaxID=587533 RepID=A0ABT9MN59_9ACTN|nr:hypothetical protein [Catenuloplanes nepalensis]MDP9792860.1 hypothetical protein [Catenuloplanes nepalensis]